MPYSFFCLITSNSWHSCSSASEISSKGNACLHLKFSCDFRLSRDTPKISVLAAANSPCRSRKFWPSVVQPGVLSFG
ncbi:hypothetical protein D3C78_1639230 [compost metagenome]